MNEDGSERKQILNSSAAPSYLCFKPRAAHTAIHPSITTRIVVVTPALDSAQAERLSWTSEKPTAGMDLPPSQPTKPRATQKTRPISLNPVNPEHVGI